MRYIRKDELIKMIEVCPIIELRKEDVDQLFDNYGDDWYVNNWHTGWEKVVDNKSAREEYIRWYSKEDKK